ncbi:LytR/AlgR family response regulator transcription factor [Ectobacillus panaciterrae]|uniref:LytR/AlgR family response regulator transcription factor n=1 Tax=Ectobacillus panaciterrae TaxID=363872 RepID=UPI000411147A|nr:LytTR family transcriptional regulator DNA-binding domain-containing protein [Ectobacillus panaciterrae]
MLKVFVVDDEPLARDELKYLLRRSKQVEIVGEADCAEDAIQQIPLVNPDLIFLDIQLSEDSGLDIAEKLKGLKDAPAIVFATAYDEYALRAFELNAVDYVLKPFDEERIQQTLEKIANIKQIGERGAVPAAEVSQASRTGKLAIAIEDRILLIDVEYIVFVGAGEGRTVIKTLEAEYRTGDTLTLLEKKLPSNMFMRVHRAFLINVNHITEVQPWFNATYNIMMKDGSKVPVSRTYTKELKNLLGL